MLCHVLVLNCQECFVLNGEEVDVKAHVDGGLAVGSLEGVVADVFLLHLTVFISIF